MKGRTITSVILALLISLQPLAGRRILFIGDSVTDGGWGNSGGTDMPSNERNHWDLNHIYGHSYMMLCAATIMATDPESGHEFLNRGISGHDLPSLAARWKTDVIDEHPDILSVLVGTNDVHYWLEKKSGQFDSAKWEKTYRSLLDEALSSNPELSIVLCTPFTARVGRVGDSPDYHQRDSLTHVLSDIVIRISHDYNATTVRFDSLFSAQNQVHPTVPMSHWIWDGIHPTAAGHKLMSDLWLKETESLCTIYK